MPIPFSNKISISQKIRSNEERNRLKRIASAVLPKNYGVIIRTAAMGQQDADIEHDITSLVDAAGRKCSTACATKRPRR